MNPSCVGTWNPDAAKRDKRDSTVLLLWSDLRRLRMNLEMMITGVLFVVYNQPTRSVQQDVAYTAQLPVRHLGSAHVQLEPHVHLDSSLQIDVGSSHCRFRKKPAGSFRRSTQGSLKRPTGPPGHELGLRKIALRRCGRKHKIVVRARTCQNLTKQNICSTRQQLVHI